jgi:acyl-homoserine-lactone acylase
MNLPPLKGRSMKKLVLLVAVACASCTTPQTAENRVAPDATGWQQRAATITIIRDDWGIPHVYGKTDADAVFGVIYAQAEDDFNRIETNYLNAMGRLAEAEGESEIYRDLRMKLFIDPADMQAQYASSPDWLKALMNGWADGLNYYLHTHPDVAPRVITRFEPWMALTFSEGSIGGDIERVSLSDLEAFYGKGPATPTAGSSLNPGASAAQRAEARPGRAERVEGEPTGSNGIAVAPSNTAGGKALLLINPHTSFFFRAEAQMVSEEGLNAYGAITWGQFFIYQGFNDKAGWMHTSSSVDNIDEYLETISKRPDGSLTYRVGTEERPLTATTITIPYKTSTGMADRTFTVYKTHRGPIVRQMDGKWVSVRLMQEPLKALTQSYSRTKARNYQEFRKTMELYTNSSNNTVFADAEGNIAYFHANFIPKRDTGFDWTEPVDGANPATEWQGVHSIDESPDLLNPPNGWIQNTNNWPYSAAGANSRKPQDYPAYVDAGSENPRGIQAIRVLEGRKDFTVDSLVAAAYDTYLTEFAILIPTLVDAYDRAPASSPLKAKLAEPIMALRGWDLRWAVDSVPTALAVYWGEELWRRSAPDARRTGVSVYEYIEKRAAPAARLEAFAAAVDKMTADFGQWATPWGEINRFQRLTGDIVQPFNDEGPSIPVGFTSARWGSLASFGARTYPGTKRMYGTSGNSFVAVVEFGDQVKARAVTAGGLSSDPKSRHFNDQAERYSTGDLRDVYFYRSQLQGHTEREYNPGK